MESNDATMPKFCSVYLHGVDEKRRVQVPAKWRPRKEGIELTLVLWPKYKEGLCVRVLPPLKFDEMLGDLDAMSNDDPAKPVLKRLIGSDAEQVTLDKSGRICLPEGMARAAGITKEAVLVGMLDRFEIWNPERHRMVKASDSALAPEAFRRME